MSYEYKLKGDEITKDGHTMHMFDVVTDLQRKSWLEDNSAPISELKKMLKHAAPWLEAKNVEANWTFKILIDTINSIDKLVTHADNGE